MPKVVDPVERKQELVRAVWRVIRRDGLAEASVRNVAKEAGLSMGSLRHYFGSQAELMTFALQMVIDRIEARIAALDPDPDPRRRAEQVLLELLPVDADRQAENEVWLAFTIQAMVNPGLRALRDAGYDTLRAGCRGLVEGLSVTDVEQEADRLHALVDGLAVHAAMRPDLNSPAHMRQVVTCHLNELESRTTHPRGRT